MTLFEKSSIILTPTAYDNGSINTVKPEYIILPTELVTNGTFDTDSDWAKGTNCTIENGKAKYTNSPSGQGFTQSNFLTIGKTYKITFTVSDFSLGLVKIRYPFNSSNTITSNGTYTEYGVATSDDLFFQNVGTTTLSIDNVSVKEVTEADFDFTRASVATRVNEQGVIEEVASGIPRIDYTSGFGSWLLEPESTNLFLNSANLSTQDVTTTATSFSVSFYGTGTITFSGTHTGTLTGTGVNERVSVTFTPTSGTLTCTVSGSVTNAQIENLSYSTSYIPTEGSIVTRSADVANNSGNADLFNDSEGVLYAQIAALANDSEVREIAISDGTVNNRIELRYGSASDRIQVIVRDGGIVQCSLSSINYNILQQNKVAGKYKLNDFAIWINGFEQTIDTSGTTPTGLSELAFDDGGGGFDFYGKTKELAVFKEALTDAELESLTSWISFVEMATDLEYTIE